MFEGCLTPVSLVRVLAGGQAGVHLEWLAGLEGFNLDNISVRTDDEVVAVGVGGR